MTLAGSENPSTITALGIQSTTAAPFRPTNFLATHRQDP
jgi:hypothetical protein